ncbi:unnamed protein product [Alopecurus aequalis]
MASSVGVSFRARGLIVFIQAMLLVSTVIMYAAATPAMAAGRFLLPFFREEKPPIAVQPVCFLPPCPKN